MKIIPTPYYYNHTEAKENITALTFVGAEDNLSAPIKWGLGELKKICAIDMGNGLPLEFIAEADSFFDDKNAYEQGYILKRNDSKITLNARCDAGYLYGLMTLVELIPEMPETFEIRDFPQIRYRGNMYTLWAETGVWSHDFGDGIDAATERIFTDIDNAARAKLNLMYIDAFGFRHERFEGYDSLMTRISKYAADRCVRLMVGGYGMGYGLSSFIPEAFMGRVFRNSDPYPNGEVYDCIGTCKHELHQPQDISTLGGRSYGTCLSNDALTEDKISELREYLEKTGVSVLYLHNMDSEELHESLWLGRCDRCKKHYPSDDLMARDGAAGAFADFYDKVYDSLREVCPNLILCPVSPGYADTTWTSDTTYERCCRFWSAVTRFMKNRENIIPLFRENFMGHDKNVLRFDTLKEHMEERPFGCVYFSGGDGFLSGKNYVPSAAFAYTMYSAELVICANGDALHRPTQYANAEYLWNPDASAFFNAEHKQTHEEFMKYYDELRNEVVRPEGLYGENGLLETSCAYLFGEKAKKDVADLYRMHTKNGTVIFNACSTEIFCGLSMIAFPMSWELKADADKQTEFRSRFMETAYITGEAERLIRSMIDSDKLRECDVAYFESLHSFCKTNAQLCRFLVRYMDIYIEADKYFADGSAVSGDLIVAANTLADEVDSYRATLEQKTFDILGGVVARRDDLFEFVSYSARIIVESLKTDKRIPDGARAVPTANGW